jgi:hypothetical protein
MIELMHPDEILAFAREHQNELLRLVETERVLKTVPQRKRGLIERMLLWINDVVIVFKPQTNPEDVEVICQPSSGGSGVCIV